MKPAIIVFSGYSGAGKDTAAEVVPHSLNVKFAAKGKRALEYIYGLEPGFLEDRVKRLQIAPHSGGRTYLQVLIDFWEHRDLLVGADLFPQQTSIDIVSTLNAGKNVVITDMRNDNEADVLECLAKDGYNLYLFWITGGKAQRSDIYSKKLIHSLQPYSVDGQYRSLVNEHEGLYEFQAKVRNAVADIVGIATAV